MKLRLHQRLIYAQVILTHQGRRAAFERVIVDTGSAATIFSVDGVAVLGLHMERSDVIEHVYGVGGTEFVFTKSVAHVGVGELQLSNFQIQVGAMHYGLDLDGIIGMDFLLQTHAIIDLHRLEIYPATNED